MKVIAIVLILVGILIGANYSITGEVVAEGVEKAPGIFERFWNFIKGMFFDDVNESVGAVAEVAVEILPNGVESLE